MKPARTARSEARTPPRPAAPAAPGRDVPWWLAVAPLVLVLLARIALQFAGGSALWGLDLVKLLPGALPWSLLVLLALALVPQIPAALASGLRALSANGPWPALGFALGTAALVLALPDQSWFVGDFQMRREAITTGQFGRFLPETLPLDLALHYDLPRALHASFGLDTALYARMTGALEAALLGLLGLAFARLVAPAGEARAHTLPGLALAVVLGAPLAMFTGFPKSTADLCVLVLALAVLGLRLIEGRRVHMAFGAVLAIALVDHRSMLVLLPAAVYAVWQRVRAKDGAGLLAQAVLPPLAALAWITPMLDRIVREYDMPMHFSHPDVPTTSAAATLAGLGLRAADVGNALLLVAPSLLLAPLVALAWPRLKAAAGTRFLLVLAAAFVPVVLLVHPRQGLPRDWEIFAPAAVAFTLLVAAALASLVQARRLRRAMSVTFAVWVAVPSLTLVLQAHSADLGLARARALLAGPPARDTIERTFLWDYIACRTQTLARMDESLAAMEKVAELNPTRAVLLTWALTAVEARDAASAKRAFVQMRQLDPDDAVAAIGLGGAAEALQDGPLLADVRALLAPSLADPRRRAGLRRMLGEHPGLWPSLADSLGL